MAYKPDYSTFESKPTTKTGVSSLNSQIDLGKYGIDYTQEQQDAIANIFKQSATGAYKQAQNQYATDMANQQATLSDTIRRSQADAVATGASRGVQAANELSAMLGLQQAAAEGATQMQGDYAAALAQAQQQAAELQNARAQVGSQLYEADTSAAAQRYAAEVSADAQRYEANTNFAANDFVRIWSEAMESGDPTKLKMALAANGVPDDQINAIANEAFATSGTQYSADTGEGYVPGITYSTSGLASGLDIDDIITDHENESGLFIYNGTEYDIEVNGAPVDSKTATQLNKLLGTGNVGTGDVVVYKNRLYFSAGGEWHIINVKDDANKLLGAIKEGS